MGWGKEEAAMLKRFKMTEIESKESKRFGDHCHVSLCMRGSSLRVTERVSSFLMSEDSLLKKIKTSRRANLFP